MSTTGPTGPLTSTQCTMNSAQQTAVIQAEEMRSWMPHPIRNWNERFTLYYDETNNIRRLKLSEVGLNIPENKASALAGIALREGQTRAGIADLRRALRLNANAPELKTRHIAEGDFEATLASRRLQTFSHGCSPTTCWCTTLSWTCCTGH